MRKLYTDDILKMLQGRIAVVGNASAEYEIGELIDSYDCVIRFNNYEIAEYEKRVGTKCNIRCVTGWYDVKNYNDAIEVNPFCREAMESSNLSNYEQGNEFFVYTAQVDVHDFIPIKNPSAGLALLWLLNFYQIKVDVFNFDGFKTQHYFGGEVETTHSASEFEFILGLNHVIVVAETYPYKELYNYVHSIHSDYDENVGLMMYKKRGFSIANKRILEFGSGNGDLASFLHGKNNLVTAFEVSDTGFEKIKINNKVKGGGVALALHKERHDYFLSFDVLEHLTKNDAELVIREAAKTCRQLLVTVSTRPSGLLGPAGENLHLTVESIEWWKSLIEKYFCVEVSDGDFPEQYYICGWSLHSNFIGFDELLLEDRIASLDGLHEKAKYLVENNCFERANRLFEILVQMDLSSDLILRDYAGLCLIRQDLKNLLSAWFELLKNNPDDGELLLFIQDLARQ
ncbi:glycosyltransferase family 29 protein [uncultured Deefgea sp.]|uniref:glycosyltransferase family 29 protein n=1 Tax=uncultured Deefgea sp. TaxID=1304914 RepID=UPI0025963FBD|nr:glycosyltransferase family 29 protein [uncultured Deefgea sp.]